MALNDTFTIQDINLDKKDLLCNIKPKRLKSFWESEFEKHQSNDNYKIFSD